MSIDTRLPVGIMPATSWRRPTALTSSSEPLGFVWLQVEADGCARTWCSCATATATISQQYYAPTEPTGSGWRYNSTRERKP